MSDTKLAQIRDREVKGQWLAAAFTVLVAVFAVVAVLAVFTLVACGRGAG